MIPVQRNFHNPEYKKRKRKVFLWKLGIFVFVIAVCVGGFAALTQWSKISIDTISVEGTYLLSPKDIEKTVFEVISKNYLYIFSQKNALLYPKEELLTVLSKTYPRIKTIRVSLSDYHTITVSVTERSPKALWCDTPKNTASTTTEADSFTHLTSSHCYFLDDTGFVYSESPDFSGDVYFKYYGLVPFQSAIGASYLASSTKFVELSNFVDAVKKLNITPLYIVATSQDDFTLYMYGGGKIIFDDTEPLSETAEHLRLLLETANLVPQEKGELKVEYIDLRYGNKLYYKVRE